MQPPARRHKPRGKPDIPRIGRGVPSARAGDPAPAGLLAGLAEFNAGQFFECHETLEALWVVEIDPIRYLYQGILQIGVGLYHFTRGNFRGALSLSHRGLTLLQPFRPRAMGIDIEQLVADSERWRAALVALGPVHLQELDRRLKPQVRLFDGSRPLPATPDPGAAS